ncbi:MAG: DUF2142 domain-containing protein [Microbacterium sp.]|uniref:DUF2142 domain-containing protein n=1 Tax=Microbacterium ginsengisoli TaxID=400772 RepID=A0A0F0LQV7_9MICO|nr:DUF2142 domain-containing protein [Microbacterium ginsengisoli]KJL35602.1 hypothetical protein RR49_02361 [Microbacterium ginsengisoli]MAL06961.1 DUF2142 domain-containing protein [Microbacterium sp.]MBN9209095.1 DUF2142 domain-containing protein [Microbacterium ginsengisoli]HAN26034.1 DUF2142 domain-containing protein [Microbacterium ginsengisoli]
MTALDHARTRRWLAASLIFAGLLAIGLAWAGASPLFAGPDEPRHMATAYATYHGQVGHSDIIVPSMFASAAAEAPCFALNPSATADCLVIAAGPDVEVASQFSSYSPLYYMLVGWPTLFLHGEYALYGMRAANSLLFALVLTAAIMILHPRGRKSAALCGMLVSLTPMALFLSGVVNASALELSSACLVASLAVRAFQTTRASWVIWSGLAGSVALLSLTRPLSPLWAGAIVAAALLSSPIRVRDLLRDAGGRAAVAAGLSMTAVAAAVAWALAHPTQFIVTQPPPASLQDAVVIFVKRLLLDTPTMITQMAGVLGWLDTPVGWALVAFLVGLGAFGIVAFPQASGRARLVVLGLTLFTVCVPIALTTALWSGTGWQGRYSLPLVAAIGVVLGWHATADRRMRRVFVVLAVLMVTAAVVAFAVQFVRYAFGLNLDDSWSKVAWTPPGSWALWSATLGVGLLAFVIGLRLVVGPHDRIRERRSFRPLNAQSPA